MIGVIDSGKNHTEKRRGRVCEDEIKQEDFQMNSTEKFRSKKLQYVAAASDGPNFPRMTFVVVRMIAAAPVVVPRTLALPLVAPSRGPVAPADAFSVVITYTSTGPKIRI